MSFDYSKLRLDGIYQQNKEGHLMLRVKIPAGILSLPQAKELVAIAENFSNGFLHLTCRGSIEFHWLQESDIKQIFRQLSAVGLTSRGACGGAVRGVSCSTNIAPEFPKIQNFIRRLHRHFTGNPSFEGLPKKFKISVDASPLNSRHLIQDVGLVLSGESTEGNVFDVWCAGGLGREPQAAFLLKKAVAEDQIIPLVESIIQVYRDNTPPPKRLKHLIRNIGKERFRSLLAEEQDKRPISLPQVSLESALLPYVDNCFEVPIFAGEIHAKALQNLSEYVSQFGEQFLIVSPNQNILLPLPQGVDHATVIQELSKSGVSFSQPEDQVSIRVCPGSHECRMGLVKTRDVARRIVESLHQSCSSSTWHLNWALSGCPNSCSQPQLADVGILTSKLAKNSMGKSEPCFDVYRRTASNLGTQIANGLTYEELRSFVQSID